MIWQNKIYREGLIRALIAAAAVSLGLYYFIKTKGDDYSLTRPISRFFTKLVKGLPETLSYTSPENWNNKGMLPVFDQEKDEYVEPSYKLLNNNSQITLYRTQLKTSPIASMQEWINDFRKDNSLDNIKVNPNCSLGKVSGACAYINSATRFHFVFYSSTLETKLGFHLHGQSDPSNSTALQAAAQSLSESIEVNQKLEFKGY